MLTQLSMKIKVVEIKGKLLQPLKVHGKINSQKAN